MVRARRWTTGLLAVVLVAVGLVPLASVGISPAAAVTSATTPGSTTQASALPPGVSVDVTPTTNLIDGQRVTITIRATAAYPIYQAEARVCRRGVDYQPSSGNRPSPDAEGGGPNCPDIPISSSADVASVDINVLTQAQSPQGNVMSMRVGAGVVAWPSASPQYNLTCDADNPCELVVQLFGGPGPVAWTPFTTDLSYRIEDPIAGCGGPAAGVLATGGSDRVSDAWVGWTLEECHQPGRVGAPGRASFLGEGAAMAAYNSGNLDLAYSALGFDQQAKLAGADVTADTARKSASVPVGLNATVLAVGGGIRDKDNQKVPYQDVRLTLDEVTAMVAGGDQGLRPYYPAIEARNPDLALGIFDTIPALATAGPIAYADEESTSWLATRHLDTLRRSKWVVPNLPGYFGPEAGRQRGVDANLALADPSYAGAINLVTGRPPLTKAIISISPTSSGGVWVLTDLVTAKALGLTIVQIENANGQYVEPTPASMAAAVPTMKADANGVLIPDPSAAAPAGQVQPYPLTFVEYAIAPTEPLADGSNVCRTDSQKLMSEWLTYLTTDGQATMPAGMQPLTADLKAEAATRVAEVGATPAATPCTEAAAPPPSSTAGGGDFASSGGSSSGSGSSGPSGSSRPITATRITGSSSGDGATGSSGAGAQAELAAANAEIPDYAGGALPNAVVAAVALVGLIGLTYLAATLTSGPKPDPATGGLEHLPPPPTSGPPPPG